MFHRNRTEENRVMQADRKNQDPVTKEGKSSPSFQPPWWEGKFLWYLVWESANNMSVIQEMCTWTDLSQHQFVLVCLISRHALSSEIPKLHYAWEKKPNLLSQAAEALNHNNLHNMYMRAKFFHKSLNSTFSWVKRFLKCLNNETGRVNISVLLQPSDLRKWHLPSVLGRRLHAFLPYFCKTRKPQNHSSFDR